MAQITAYKGEIGLFDVHPFQAGHPFYSPAVGDVAPQTIYRVGRIDDNPSFTEDFRNFPDIFGVRVLVVDFDQHG